MGRVLVAFFLAVIVAAFLLLHGCSSQKRTLADLKEIPPEGETGVIAYDEEGNQITGSVPGVNVGIGKGDLAPDFTVTATDGKRINLRELSASGQPVIVYFWASWCPYCRQDFASAKDVYPKYADKVRFVAIDLDLSEDIGLIASYKEKGGHALIDFALGYEQVLRDYSITHTTAKYAVGRNGTILWKGSGVMDERLWEVLLNGLAES